MKDAFSNNKSKLRLSDNNGTRVCYVCHALDISMSLASAGTSGTEEVAALVSLLCSHVPEIYKRTKWPV
jgi:hypothetical protein